MSSEVSSPVSPPNATPKMVFGKLIFFNFHESEEAKLNEKKFTYFMDDDKRYGGIDLPKEHRSNKPRIGGP